MPGNLQFDYYEQWGQRGDMTQTCQRLYQ